MDNSENIFLSLFCGEMVIKIVIPVVITVMMTIIVIIMQTVTVTMIPIITARPQS